VTNVTVHQNFHYLTTSLLSVVLVTAVFLSKVSMVVYCEERTDHIPS